MPSLSIMMFSLSNNYYVESEYYDVESWVGTVMILGLEYYDCESYYYYVESEYDNVEWAGGWELVSGQYRINCSLTMLKGLAHAKIIKNRWFYFGFLI